MSPSATCKIERDNDQLRKKIAAATNSLAQTFDRIVVLLTERGFIDVRTRRQADPMVTDDGRLLARIYSESDLLVAECLRTGVWEGLDAAELAAALSSVLYESRARRTRRASGADVPTGRLRRALNQTRRLWTELRADEQRHRITPEPRTRRRFRRRDLPVGEHRRPGLGVGRVRHRRHRIVDVGGRLRAGGAVRCWTWPTRCAMPLRHRSCGRPRNAQSTTFGAASLLLMRGRVWPAGQKRHISRGRSRREMSGPQGSDPTQPWQGQQPGPGADQPSADPAAQPGVAAAHSGSEFGAAASPGGEQPSWQPPAYTPQQYPQYQQPTQPPTYSPQQYPSTEQQYGQQPTDYNPAGIPAAGSVRTAGRIRPAVRSAAGLRPADRSVPAAAAGPVRPVPAGATSAPVPRKVRSARWPSSAALSACSPRSSSRWCWFSASGSPASS